MSDEFKDLAQVAADAVVSAMAADSYEAAKRRFVTLFGHDRQKARLPHLAWGSLV